jgi:hypothetical protein
MSFDVETVSAKFQMEMMIGLQCDKVIQTKKYVDFYKLSLPAEELGGK